MTVHLQVRSQAFSEGPLCRFPHGLPALMECLRQLPHRRSPFLVLSLDDEVEGTVEGSQHAPDVAVGVGLRLTRRRGHEGCRLLVPSVLVVQGRPDAGFKLALSVARLALCCSFPEKKSQYP